MEVLVTGGTGFVGSHLIEQLVADGVQVRALVRTGSNAAFVESLGATVVTGDLEDEVSLREACRGCDIIFHAAARVEIVGSEEEFHRTTVAGTERLVSAARDAGVRRFVYVSSCGVYHPALLASGREIDELTISPEPPDWFTYGRAKYRAEWIVRHNCPPDMEWVILRLGYLYGPRNRVMQSYFLPVFKKRILMIIGDGANEMSLVYVDDAARAIKLAGLVREASGKILIAGGHEGVTQQEFFDAMADGFGLPRVRKRVPYGVAFYFAWLGERWIKKEPDNAIVRRSAVALTGLPQRLNCAYTCRLLGWHPQMSFAEGMRRAFDWYHAEYAAPTPASA